MANIGRPPLDYIKKARADFSYNRGGVNFGKTENTLELLELANGHNFDLDPRGGFKKRNGTQGFLTNLYWYQDQNDNWQTADHTGLDMFGCMIFWCSPSGSKQIMFVNTAEGLSLRYQTGLIAAEFGVTAFGDPF